MWHLTKATTKMTLEYRIQMTLCSGDLFTKIALCEYKS